MSLRRSKWVVLLATVAGVALTARLCLWQLDRAAQKSALQSALDTRSQLAWLDAQSLARSADEVQTQHYRPVRLHGRWLTERSVFLENRQMDGRVGFYLVTPLLLAPPADAVLVQRGWTPRDQIDRTRVPVVSAAGGEVEVEGLIAPPPARLFEFRAAAGGTIRQNLDLDAFARETALQLRPLSVLQSDSPATAGDGLLRHWPRPAADVEKHYGYAFQWAALSTLMTGLYVWFQLIRPRLRRGS